MPGLAKKKIIVIEDEESIRVAVKDLLKDIPVEILEAEDGVQALKIMEENKPDLVLLDVIMPKMHGIDMLKELRNKPWGKDIPVVLLTNYADDPKVVEAVKKGMCELMDKTKSRLNDVLSIVKKKLKV